MHAILAAPTYTAVCCQSFLLHPCFYLRRPGPIVGRLLTTSRYSRQSTFLSEGSDELLRHPAEENLGCEIVVQNGSSDLVVLVETTGNNRRRFTVSIAIEGPLEAVWNVLTDYEGLADFLPGLAICELQERWENGARLFQVGEQNLAFGLKFKAKGVINVHENPLEVLADGRQRNIDFEMIEGDFQVFKGTWHMKQGPNNNDSVETTILTYIVDVQPRMWLPVQLVEGRLNDEIKSNLMCVRNQVLQCIDAP